eukprot:6747401-Alexandrium_andersonii.AAC.1
MSASLVGSEMCIRDRPGPPKVAPLVHAGGASWGFRGAVAPPTEQQGVPVSYTHLTLPTICSV